MIDNAEAAADNGNNGKTAQAEQQQNALSDEQAGQQLQLNPEQLQFIAEAKAQADAELKAEAELRAREQAQRQEQAQAERLGEAKVDAQSDAEFEGQFENIFADSEKLAALEANASNEIKQDDAQPQQQNNAIVETEYGTIKLSNAAEANSESEPFIGKLYGEDVELKGVRTEEIKFTKRERVEYDNLEKNFNSTVRKNFLFELSTHVEFLRGLGFSDADILRMKSGNVPKGWEVHHILPLDDSGTNDFSNLILIQKHPYHKACTNYQNTITRRFVVRESHKIPWPTFDGSVYAPRN